MSSTRQPNAYAIKMDELFAKKKFLTEKKPFTEEDKAALEQVDQKLQEMLGETPQKIKLGKLKSRRDALVRMRNLSADEKITLEKLDTELNECEAVFLQTLSERDREEYHLNERYYDIDAQIGAITMYGEPTEEEKAILEPLKKELKIVRERWDALPKKVY